MIAWSGRDARSGQRLAGSWGAGAIGWKPFHIKLFTLRAPEEAPEETSPVRLKEIVSL